MPRRNRNAGVIRPDPDQLAADLDQLAAEIHAVTGHGKHIVIARYLAARPGGKQLLPVPAFASGST